MSMTAELATVPDTIEATLNYIVNDGTKLFTYTGGPGSLDVRTGGTPDPRRMTVHNGRLHADRFVLEQEGFRFIPHDTRMRDFFDEDEVRRVYYAEMEALVFKVYDSLEDGRARWTAHTAFEDPTSPPNAAPRESIEIRTLAFF